MSDDAVDLAALSRWIREFASLVRANTDLLTRLDAAIGDADHGANMDRGMSAVVAALDQPGGPPPAGPAALLKAVGMTLVSTVGGASGPLYGTFFLRAATALGDDAGLVAENKDLLTHLDAAIGDADHGANMHRGLTAAVAAVDSDMGDQAAVA
ncbi:MAG: DAK2 domain-containing protein, partial [Catenulispora sp.]